MFFLLWNKYWLLVKLAFCAVARNRGFPAMVFSAVSFFLVTFFSLLVFSSSITWSALSHFSLIGLRVRQALFVGNRFFLVVAFCPQACHNIGKFFGGVIFPAWFRASPRSSFSRLGVFSAIHAV